MLCRFNAPRISRFVSLHRNLSSAINNESTCGKASIRKDVYGPPDPKSSLRLVTFYIPPDETKEEMAYRLQRAQVQDWNQEFWTAHNIQFNQAKESFVTNFTAKKGGNSEAMTADELSEFYRSFLNDNWDKHFRYNVQWHQKNLRLIWPGLKANLSRIKRRFLN